MFSVSCGYRNAFDQYANLIKDKYPGVNVEGANYSPSYPKALGAQASCARAEHWGCRSSAWARSR